MTQITPMILPAAAVLGLQGLACKWDRVSCSSNTFSVWTITKILIYAVLLGCHLTSAEDIFEYWFRVLTRIKFLHVQVAQSRMIQFKLDRCLLLSCVGQGKWCKLVWSPQYQARVCYTLSCYSTLKGPKWALGVPFA